MQCEFVVAVCTCGTICIGCGSELVGRFFGGSMAAEQAGMKEQAVGQTRSAQSETDRDKERTVVHGQLFTERLLTGKRKAELTYRADE